MAARGIPRASSPASLHPHLGHVEHVDQGTRGGGDLDDVGRARAGVEGEVVQEALDEVGVGGGGGKSGGGQGEGGEEVVRISPGEKKPISFLTLFQSWTRLSE